ncbi:MAG: hypothetical protein ACK559_08210, partial [bacterium]
MVESPLSSLTVRREISSPPFAATGREAAALEGAAAGVAAVEAAGVAAVEAAAAVAAPHHQ